MQKRFQKKVEDFICAHCNAKVTGTGYTNHCPSCLWSRHVDIFPGDRAAGCNGMMKPVAIEKNSETYIVTHQCIVCGHKSRNRVVDTDDFDMVIKISDGTHMTES